MRTLIAVAASVATVGVLSACGGGTTAELDEAGAQACEQLAAPSSQSGEANAQNRELAAAAFRQSTYEPFVAIVQRVDDSNGGVMDVIWMRDACRAEGYTIN